MIIPSFPDCPVMVELVGESQPPPDTALLDKTQHGSYQKLNFHEILQDKAREELKNLIRVRLLRP